MEALKVVSEQIPNVNSFYHGDVYEINTKRDVRYMTVNVTNKEETIYEGDEYMQYRVYIFAIDRETEDDSNVIDVQSHCIDVLRAILESMDVYVLTSNVVFHPFRERFNDDCAGAWAEVVFKVPVDECGTYMIHADAILRELEINRNGVYNAQNYGADGFSKVTVNVEGGGATDAYTKAESDAKYATKQDNKDGVDKAKAYTDKEVYKAKQEADTKYALKDSVKPTFVLTANKDTDAFVEDEQLTAFLDYCASLSATTTDDLETVNPLYSPFLYVKDGHYGCFVDNLLILPTAGDISVEGLFWVGKFRYGFVLGRRKRDGDSLYVNIISEK